MYRLAAIALVLLGASAGAMAQQLSDAAVPVTNLARSSITELDLRQAGNSGWSRNQLQSTGIPAGHTLGIQAPSGTHSCAYEARAVFQDGHSEQQKIDFCRRQAVLFGRQR
jgi:hypothetical protein